MQKLVLVITSKDSGETLERWVFDLQTDKSVGPADRVDKSDKEIQSEIAAIQRQITASVTFLPLNDEPCVFDLLVYTDDDLQVPTKWETSVRRPCACYDALRLLLAACCLLLAACCLLPAASLCCTARALPPLRASFSLARASSS